MRILVVEDSRTQAESLRYILEKRGNVVTLATNGREALEQMGVSRPDIVLTDIVMPEMDGYELCRRIKTDKKLQSIPVIMVTQLFDPVDVVRGLEAGADNFIIKPYEPRDIETRIQNVMTTRNSPDPGVSCTAFEITLADGKHTIAANRRQILDILLSTYEITVRKNSELQEAHEQLNLLNEQLRQSVADQKQANRDLQEENAERLKAEKALAEANKKLHLMASITRHDINNQILALNGFVALLQREISDPSFKTYFSRIREASNLIDAMIRFTKEYEKIGAGVPVWQDIETIVNTAAKGIIPGQVILKNDLPAGTEVFADPMLQKVFFNLLDNAIRHGKRVTEIRVSSRRSGEDLVVVWEDNGIGIAADEKDLIFERGFGKNTGLGLFLAREILSLTGITIKETGEPGKGARFEISCPQTTVRCRL